MQARALEYPISLLPSLRYAEFVCPLCQGDLVALRESYSCERCEREYRLHCGIPDFRVFPDPYLSFDEDRERTEIVLGALERYKLEPLLEYYWTFSDITPPDLRPRFVRSAMLGEKRAMRTMRVIGSGGDSGTMRRRVLEIGSGTGNFLAVAVERDQQVIGIDIAMRWLHLSRRRFMDKGLAVPPLVCCCAEYLPFRDGAFDLIVMSSTLEFVRDQRKVFAECARLLGEGGSLYVNTVNRFSIARDPYAYLWGVGFLSRAWQAGYVRWRRGARYEQIRLLSLGELKRLAGECSLAGDIQLPDIDDAALSGFSRLTRLQVRLYRLLKALPVFGWLLKWIGPGWDATFSVRGNIAAAQTRPGH